VYADEDDEDDGMVYVLVGNPEWMIAATDIVLAFGCEDWNDYLHALRNPARRADLQALAATWKEN
jgi:hypothetical protein